MKHIYVIEDERPIRRMISRMLERSGYHVTPFESATEAFDAFQQVPVELIITDHNLPDYSGTELVKKIKEIAPKTNAILMSGYLADEIQTTLFDAHIDKPILDLNEVISAVQSIPTQSQTIGA